MQDTIYKATAWDIAFLATCNAFTYDRQQPTLSITAPNDVIFRNVITHILTHQIGDRYMRKYVSDLLALHQLDRTYYESVYNQIITTLVLINKKLPITSTNISMDILLDDQLAITAEIDILYNRKDGGSCTVILPPSIGTEPHHMVAAHPVICAAILACENQPRMEYVEAILPNSEQKYCERLIINKDKEYIEYCKRTITTLVRRFNLEKEHDPIWTNRCLWCPQAGRCSLFREKRSILRRVVQLIGQ